ncbi:MAG: BTAD domain-containing putative transcriptional regulator [Sporichthyaceae bacterium]
MQFRVLGAVELVVDGHGVAVGGNRERAVLARLLMSANRVVSLDTLIGDLWPDRAPDGAAAAIQVYVSRLRKALRAERAERADDVLITRPPGYVLAVAPEMVDAARFEALARAGREAAAAGEHRQARGTLAEALALWRGPAFGGLDDLPFARGEAARLDELRLGALETRVECDLACGRAMDAASELASLTAEHPLRERLWALRMTALYQGGRQAEALAVYRELRARLDEELGIEPSVELRELERAILRQELAPAAAPNPPAPAAAPSPSGVVTFMFTDLVGSTELLDRLGDDAADDLRRRHFSALRAALRAHGGSEVKSLGDGLMAAFASAVAALRCAVEIQQAAAVAGGGDEAVAIRVGVHAGEATLEEDDFFGTPVVVAQRLCGRASGGQIVASSLVQGLVGSRAGCTFTPLGELTLKGFGEPVAACEVVWAAPEPAPALPFPATLPRPESVFVRPEADMVRLEAAWEAARSGRRQVVLLTGDPGIGKTRRCAELARMVHETGAVVLHGRCDDGLAVPYQPFVEALGTYVRQAAKPALGRLAGELTRLVPEVGGRMPDLPAPLSADPETERYRLFDAVAAWLAAVGEEAPTLFVVEDVHWATPPTLAMLSHLARSGEPNRLLVVVNYRDSALDLTPALADAVAGLLRQPDVDRVVLGGLDQAGVAAYLEAVGAHQGADLAAVLHAETAGNPFYLGEMLRDFGETGVVTEVPDSVRDVIARRLARLPESTRRMLEFAAIAGDRFDVGLLGRASDRTPIAVLQALDPAVAARLTTEPDEASGQSRFVHALVRHTLVDGLSAGGRMELHRATGVALAELAGEDWQDLAAELARHWLAATPAVGSAPDDAARTLDFVEEAAGRAAASLAYEEAVDLLTRALPLSARGRDPVRRARLAVALGEAQYRAGDPAHEHTLADATAKALEVGDPELAARAALANQRTINVLLTGDHERIVLLERVLAALGEADGSARARVLAALSITVGHDDPRRYECAREAVAVARRLDDPIALGRVLGLAVFVLWRAESLPEQLALAVELADLAARSGDPVLEVEGGLALYYAATQHGDVDVGRDALALAVRAAGDIGQAAFRLRTLTGQQNSAMVDGRFAEFFRFAADAVTMAETLDDGPLAHINRHGDGGLVRLIQGHLAEAIEGIEKAADAFPSDFRTWLLAWPLAEAGRREEAAALIASAGGAALSWLPGSYVRLYALAWLAPAAAILDDRELAERIYSELEPYESRIVLGQMSAPGPVAHYLGVLAASLRRDEQADAHFARAVEIAERTGARVVLVRTRLEWARLLLRRGRGDDHERVLALAAAARDLARAQDAGELGEQAAELLLAGVRT